MVPSNEAGGAGGKLWGQLESCKEKKWGTRGETANMRTKKESKESSLLSSLLSVDI